MHILHINASRQLMKNARVFLQRISPSFPPYTLAGKPNKVLCAAFMDIEKKTTEYDWKIERENYLAYVCV